MQTSSSKSIRCLFVVAVAAVAATGCHRHAYRQAAENEAYYLIDEKLNHPHWCLSRTSIQIDPQSRMYDPFDPDRPPMPADDPISHIYMHNVDDRPGYPHWHASGDTNETEGPCWLDYLPLDEDGVLVLDMDEAFRLALIHSTDLQQQHETLFLSALDVSTERFQFDTQTFGGYGSDYRTSGRLSNQPRSRWQLGTTGGRGGTPNPGGRITANRMFVTGADLVVGFANRLVWDLHGPDVHTATSLVDFSLLQPLLRDAGRDVIMENLTRSERNLLANVRALERFRRGFYFDVTVGANPAGNLSRSSGNFATGLFTGLGGGFGGVNVGGGGGGGGVAGGGAAPQVGGFMGLLQDQLNIRFTQANVVSLRINLATLKQTAGENLKKIPDNPIDIVRDQLQIAQTQQSLYQQELGLLNSQAAYQSSLDTYKTGTLGLPPHICLRIEDDFLGHFNLVDDSIFPLQGEVTRLSNELGVINEQLLAMKNGTSETDQDLLELLTGLKRRLSEIRELKELIETDNFAEAEDDVAALREAVPDRKESIQSLREKYIEISEEERRLGNDCQTRLPADLDPETFSTNRLERLPKLLDEELDRLGNDFAARDQELSELSDSLDAFIKRAEAGDNGMLFDEIEQEVLFSLPALLANIGSDLLDLSLVQARARTDSVGIVPVELDAREALQIASVYRRDWMNTRATLVDQWRLIEFIADDLEGFMNFIVEGEVGTIDNNPLEFNTATGSLRVGMQFDAPLTRLVERNRYREVLIDYQQARRSYYQFVDGTSQTLRSLIRTLDVNRLAFEQQRLAMLSAIDQVIFQDEIQDLTEERGVAQGATTARDAVDALASLQNTQRQLLGQWTAYEVNRRILDFQLGIMQVDSEGIWIDPGPMGGEYGINLPDYAQEWVTNFVLAPSDARMMEVNDQEILEAPSPAFEGLSLPDNPLDGEVYPDVQVQGASAKVEPAARSATKPQAPPRRRRIAGMHHISS